MSLSGLPKGFVWSNFKYKNDHIFAEGRIANGQIVKIICVQCGISKINAYRFCSHHE